MKSATKLKDKARQFEQKEDWQRAIDAYVEVIENSGEGELDLALLHRVGDLYLRLGRSDEAFDYYQQGVDRYADAGLYNNAIALCNKALRYLPDRIAIYRRLGQLSAEQGFVPDARRWFLEYAERATRAGAVDDALAALEELAGFAEDVEVLELLGRQLREHGRAEQAVPHLVRARALRLSKGEAEAAERLESEILAIDPSASLDAPAAAPEQEPAAPPAPAAEPEELPIESTSALAGLDTDAGADLATESLVEEPAAGETAAADLQLEELQITGFEMGEEEAAEPAVGGGIELESMLSAAGLGDEVPEEPAPEASAEPAVADEQAEDDLEPLPGWEDADEEEAEPLPLLDSADDAEAEPLPLLDDEQEAEPLPLLDAEDEEEPEPLPLLDAEGEEEPEPLPLLGDSDTAEVPEDSEPLPVLSDAEAEPAGESLSVGGLEAAESPTSEEAETGLDLGDLGFDVDFGRVDEPEEEGSVSSKGSQAAEPVRGEPEPAALAAAAGEAESLAEPEPGAVREEAEAAGSPAVAAEADPAAAAAAEVPDVEQELERIRKLPVAEAADEMVELHDALASAGALDRARVVLDEWVEIAPDDVRAYQCRLEDEVRRGADEAALVRSYVDLADCLARTGSRTKAEAVYQRVLDLEPENAAARAALSRAADAAVPGSREPAGYVDLNALLRDGEVDVAAAGAAGSQSGGGFSGMLSQLKAKTSPDGAHDDAEGHYDLGLAFKEMGLIDEAIAEFQAALRGGEERLKVYEELGQCYVMKEQYNVALKVLARALQLPRGSDEELLGVYYHLGRCYEELGERGEARTAYEKVIDFDTDFRDVAGRLARL